jgi:hypothetical protein
VGAALDSRICVFDRGRAVTQRLLQRGHLDRTAAQRAGNRVARQCSSARPCCLTWSRCLARRHGRPFRHMRGCAARPRRRATRRKSEGGTTALPAAQVALRFRPPPAALLGTKHLLRPYDNIDHVRYAQPYSSRDDGVSQRVTVSSKFVAHTDTKTLNRFRSRNAVFRDPWKKKRAVLGPLLCDGDEGRNPWRHRRRCEARGPAERAALPRGVRHRLVRALPPRAGTTPASELLRGDSQKHFTARGTIARIPRTGRATTRCAGPFIARERDVTHPYPVVEPPSPTGRDRTSTARLTSRRWPPAPNAV